MVRRRPPPPTASPANPTSKAKDYTTHREYQVQDELDELRNRGVAKFMNRHFTETSKKLAQEKAEADAALADLERRRAQTSEFVPSNGGELNPFDSLYVELQQKRSDCRRKERETMLLYQRYVHKFQKNKNAAANSKTIDRKATPPAVQEEVDGDFTDDELDLDDELELVHETPQKNPREGVNVSIDESSTPEAAAPPPSPPPAAPVQDPPGVSLRSASPTHEEEEVLKSTVEEKKMPDLPDMKSKSMPSTVPEDMSVEQEPVEVKDEPKPQQQEPPESSAPVNETSMVEGTDEPATDPVETSPAPVMEAPEDEEEETAATPILNSVSSESFSVNRPTAEVTAGDFPPGAASDEDSDDDDKSVISGLTTVNSALTRQVMDKLESEMEFFIKNETQAIQKLLDEEEEGGLNMSFGGSRISSDASVTCDKSVVASLKAEQMAEEMQKMLEQFANDEKSSVGSPESPDGDENKNATSSTSINQSLYPRKYKSPNPNEEWMVYWDEKFEREYYYEKNSNKTQWEAPVMKLGFTDNPDFTPKEMPKRTTKLVIEKKLSRSEIYKKKLQKRRMQRAAVIFVILGSLMLSAIHWKTNHAGKSYPDAMKATYFDLKDIYEYTLTNRTAEEQEAANIARMEKVRKAREAEELERKRKAAEAAKAAEAERLRLEQKKAQEEAERKRKAAQKAAEEAEKKRIVAAAEKKAAAEEKAAKEKAEKAAREKRLREEEEARLRKEAEKQRKAAEEARLEAARLEAERLAKQEEETRRPWGCNLPFSHIVHGHCRKLAKTNPIYREEHLLNSFLQ
ncbi:unnamed protein product [Cylindrotheca closterium]|uniref:WW domain-containing protein n=1 Tax=Cylindrotheca closterium TaxID=2856 RepID=A0AAD2FRC2_9STRA|nr:unnamed protein product [Cylindrotheca closterium]